MSSQDVAQSLDDAQLLAELGVPIFSSRLKQNGDPLPPSGWERTRASLAAAARYRHSVSTGLCAVTGIKYDVIDVDPRNGGEASIQRLSDELGDDGPEIYWRVKTPSGGLHLWIAPLNIGSHTGFLKGLDLKGGNSDGSSRGFVFIPPTIRPSKVTGKPFQYKRVNGPPSDAEPVRCEALAAFVERAIADKHTDNAGGAFRRNEPGSLRQDCLEAEAGDQRTALLRYVHELERRGYDPEDIVTVIMGLVMEMPTYDVDRPWTEKHIRGLLHRKGEIIADATADELEGLEDGPISGGLVRNMSDLSVERISWLWRKYLAFREITLLDGEKGQGKSFVVDGVAALASRGLPMPGCKSNLIGPINVIIFTDEGHLESTTLPRLVAQDADPTRLYTPRIKPPKSKKSQWELALPQGAERMERMIRESGARLAIWDPISDFLDESVNTHNDASVRAALRPLNGVLIRTGCAGWAIRHLNKNTSQEAKFRGTGSVAFANRARVHLIAARLPAGAESEGTFGIGMIDINLSKRIDQVLAYSIEDSDIVSDDEGDLVGKVKWHGYCNITPEELGSTSRSGHGPAPVVQDEVIDALRAMFGDKQTWDAREAEEFLRGAGITADKETVAKARRRAGVIAKARFRKGRIDGWDWKLQSKVRMSEEGAPRRK